MSITVALAGNPNSGKTTLFNALTGSNQFVGNWPGVTVEKKSGKYKCNKDITIVDLPGVYSLSPYTLEEVVSRDYLVTENPDVIINIIDATNIERNLYLTTMLAELGIPVIVALNMMDLVRKKGDKIDVEKLSAALGVTMVEISALKKEGIDQLMDQAIKLAPLKATLKPHKIFSQDVEHVLEEISGALPSIQGTQFERWHAIKLFEKDVNATKHLGLSDEQQQAIDAIVAKAEKDFDDDGEGVITDARYTYVTDSTHKHVTKGTTGLTASDKIDQVVTNRFLALPIFALIIAAVYYITVTIVAGDAVTGWVNDTLIDEIVKGNVTAMLEGAGASEFITSLVGDAIIGGVGAVIGFLPLVVTLFFLLAILEEIGYMARIAFILDRILRRFGLSGKSFIPILIGTGCAVPGIMATRTIETESDRRMTIVSAAFLPCTAKVAIIGLFSATIFDGCWWFGPLSYFAGILAVVITGIILKKTSFFAGEPAPFLMELPEYHLPSLSNVLRTTWDRSKAFVVKAGTIIFLVVVILWLLQNFDTSLSLIPFDEEGAKDSILATIGMFFEPIFYPIGFAANDPSLAWVPTVASVAGLSAKEAVVGTLGMLQGVAEDADNVLEVAAAVFTPASALAFMFFNQFNVPCQACIGAMKSEMGTWKWTAFTVVYQCVFAYAIAFMTYQFASIGFGEKGFDAMTVAALVVLAIFVVLLLRRPAKKPNAVLKLEEEEVTLA